MRKNKKVFVISGAPGVGKTTLIKELSKKLPKVAHISIDKLRNFIRAGYASPNNWNEEVEKQYRLAHQNAADLTKNYLSQGYLVFIDDVFRNEWKKDLVKAIPEQKIEFIYLHASLAEIIKRNSAREYVVKKKVVVDSYNDLETNNTKKNGWFIIDTENSEKSTSEKFLSLIKR